MFRSGPSYRRWAAQSIFARAVSTLGCLLVWLERFYRLCEPLRKRIFGFPSQFPLYLRGVKAVAYLLARPIRVVNGLRGFAKDLCDLPVELVQRRFLAGPYVEDRIRMIVSDIHRHEIRAYNIIDINVIAR